MQRAPHIPVALVIEPSQGLNREISEALAPYCSVCSAFSGNEGLELFDTVRPDLVLFDLCVPDMNGDDAVGRFGGALHRPSALVVLTACREESTVIELFEAGAADIVFKPVLMPELLARSRRLLGQARRTDKTQSDFLRILAHELKTPISAVQLQVTVLERDPNVARCDATQRGLTRIARSTKRLVTLVDTVLEWSRVEDGRYEAVCEEFDLVELVETVIDQTRDAAELRSVELRMRGPGRRAPLTTDPTLVRLVVLNLVHQAVIAHQGGIVEIEIDDRANGVRIVVAGSEHCDDATQPPTHASFDGNDSGPGAELELPAVRSLARALGGNVARDAQGSGFAFELPSTG